MWEAPAMVGDDKGGEVIVCGKRGKIEERYLKDINRLAHAPRNLWHSIKSLSHAQRVSVIVDVVHLF